jgi:hypothetical protein
VSARICGSTVFAYAAHGVKSSAKLLREINEANWGLVDGRVYWRGGFVVVETSIDAQRVDAESLERACLSVGTYGGRPQSLPGRGLRRADAVPRGAGRLIHAGVVARAPGVRHW